MKKLYVIGNPIHHSLSPKIFNYWFKKYGLKYKYEKKLVSKKGDVFEKSIYKLIRTKNCYGLNVTTPFKHKAIKILDFVDVKAKKIGSVNCIYKKNNKIIGTNTDWLGYQRSLKQQKKFKKSNKDLAAVIGFGGASKAIVYALKNIGFKKIFVFIRNKNKFNEIMKFDSKIKCFELNSINKHAKKFNLIVNTTPTNKLKDLKIKTRLLKKSAIVSDINYFPHETELIISAKSHKLQATYGIYMLLYQAAPAFKKWFGFTPAVDEKLVLKCISEK